MKVVVIVWCFLESSVLFTLKKVWLLHNGGAKTLLFALLQKHLEFPFWIADE